MKSIYDSNRPHEVLSDPFSSDVLRELDSLPLTKHEFPRETRVDLAFENSTDDLPLYLYLNRSTSLYCNSMEIPTNSGEYQRLVSKLLGDT